MEELMPAQQGIIPAQNQYETGTFKPFGGLE